MGYVAIRSYAFYVKRIIFQHVIHQSFRKLKVLRNYQEKEEGRRRLSKPRRNV